MKPKWYVFLAVVYLALGAINIAFLFPWLGAFCFFGAGGMTSFALDEWRSRA